MSTNCSDKPENSLIGSLNSAHCVLYDMNGYQSGHPVPNFYQPSVLSNQQRSIDNDQANAQQQVTGPNKPIDLNFYFQEITNRLTHMERDFSSRFSNIEIALTKLDNIDKSLAQVTSRVEKVESSVNLVNHNVNACELKVNRINETHKEFNKNQKSQEVELKAAKTQIKKLQKDTEQLDDLRRQMNDLWYENGELKDKLLNIQARSMRHNLVFTGIPEVVGEDENIEDIVKTIIKEKVQISEDIDFENVHRFGGRFGGKPRKIVVRFHRFKQRELVRKNARNLAGTGIGISEQFPHEMEHKRKELYPVLRKAREWNNRAYMIRDKLYINGKLYIDPELQYEQRGEIANVTDSETISFIPDNRSDRREHDWYSRERGQHERSLKRQRVHSSEIQSGVSYAAAVTNSGSPNQEQSNSQG